MNDPAVELLPLSGAEGEAYYIQIRCRLSNYVDAQDLACELQEAMLDAGVTLLTPVLWED